MYRSVYARLSVSTEISEGRRGGFESKYLVSSNQVNEDIATRVLVSVREDISDWSLTLEAQ